MENRELFYKGDKPSLCHWLALAQCRGLGFQTLQKLARYCDHNITALFSLSEADLKSWRLDSLQELLLDRQGRIQNTLNWLSESSAHFILPVEHPDYPALLLETASPPLVLFGCGNPQVLQVPQIAIVGSRYHTPAAGQFANTIAQQLVDVGWCVTSGLALGIDAQSHLGALAGQGQTVAVMATGIDKVYPKRHSELAMRIVAEGGCLLTEFPLGTAPKKEHFPRRNRIISGLSLGVLVVEATIKSGTLITARYAVEQNREVFAVPGSVYNKNSQGCHQLLKQGAKLVEQVADINEEFSHLVFESGKSAAKKQEKNPALLLARDRLLASVGFEATSIDVVAQRSGLPVTVVMTQLLEYELCGFVASVPGGYIRLGE